MSGPAAQQQPRLPPRRLVVRIYWFELWFGAAA